MENELNKQSTPNYNKTTSDGNNFKLETPDLSKTKLSTPGMKDSNPIKDTANNAIKSLQQNNQSFNFSQKNKSWNNWSFKSNNIDTKLSIPKLKLSSDKSSGIKPKFSDKFSNSTFGKNYGLWSQGLDTANQLFTSIAGPKSEYGGKYGNLAKSLDSGYDTVSNVVGMIPGWGQAASLIMKGAGLVNNIGNKIGLGTDGMTKQDAILGTPLLAPLGWINGGLGSRTKSYVFNKQLFNQLNGSYGNALDYATQANDLQRKKFGLTSGGKKKYANNLIDESIRQVKIMEDIAGNATDRSNIAKSMTMFNNLRNNFELSGSYNYGLQAAKNGAKLSQARQILKKYKKQQINTESGEDNNGYPVKKKLQNGGTLEYSVIELVTPEIESFKQGGTINVIPDGALHAHKNNMGLDNITPKGIPVVDNDNEQQAEIEREELILIKSVTEKLEELYKKYQESQDDDIAIEAGKLLVEQILHNTQDNTNKLL